MVTNTPANGTGGIIYALTPVVPMGFEFKPSTIRLNSCHAPNRVYALLEPPRGFSADDIDVESIRLNNVLPVDPTAPVRIVVGDGDGEDDDHGHDNFSRGNGRDDCGHHDYTNRGGDGDDGHGGRDGHCRRRLKVYFSTDSLAAILPVGNRVELKVTGLIAGNRGFAGYDRIRVRGGQVVSPVASEVLTPGSVYSVAYDIAPGSAQNAALMFSPDGGATWSTEAAQIPISGTFNWVVPSRYTDNAVIALVDAAPAATGTVDIQAALAVSDPFAIHGVLAVGDAGPATRLLPPRPNPSAGTVNLGFTLARPGNVEVTIFDLQGREVAMPASGIGEAGAHEVAWNGRWQNGSKAEAGLYFVRLRAGGQEWRARLIRLK